MDTAELAQLVNSLRALKREGGYWDFKREYHDDKEELLLDVICMANNQEDRDAYIIYGIENATMRVWGVENDPNRMELSQLSQIINSKPFETYTPEIDLQTVTLEGHEVDVLIIRNTSHTPYYLERDYGKLKCGVIYVRLNDRKAGTGNEAAPYQCIEHLWKKRFGIDKSIFERYRTLLDDYTGWDFDWANRRYAFHRVFPEFQMQTGEPAEIWEPVAAFYTNNHMYEARLRLLYHTTVIFETGLWFFDGFRKQLPRAQVRTMTEPGGLGYYYYDLTTLEGQLFRIFTKGTFDIKSREQAGANQVLWFGNARERESFEEYVRTNWKDVRDEDVRDRFLNEIRRERGESASGLKPTAFQVAKAGAFFENWRASKLQAL